MGAGSTWTSRGELRPRDPWGSPFLQEPAQSLPVGRRTGQGKERAVEVGPGIHTAGHAPHWALSPSAWLVQEKTKQRWAGRNVEAQPEAGCWAGGRGRGLVWTWE